MDQRAESGFYEQISTALDWWRDAGVDGDLHDTPQTWLAAAEVAAHVPVVGDQPKAALRAPETPAPAAPQPLDRSDWPTDLASFAAWWLTAPFLDNGQTQRRVAPRGIAQAELMVLVPEPEREDTETLLSGPQGRLLDAMLNAMAIDPAAIYLASALPRHTPHADWAALKSAGLGEVLRHHVALAAPKRLICFGGSILPLLGNDPANKSDGFSIFNHEGMQVPLLAARELVVLLERPRWKAGFWQTWLDWSASG
jgi:uracil-DNA glycosylase